MSTERDVTRAVRSWLDDGPMRMPEHVLDRVLADVPATPQRHRLMVWRNLDMSTLFKVGFAAAAVLVVAIAGLTLLSRQQPNVSSQPTPPTALPSLPIGPVPAGTYSVSANTGVPYTLTVPSGWSHDEDGFLTRGSWPSGGVQFATWEVTNIFTDPCNWSGTNVPTPSKSEFVSRLVAQPGHTTTGPTETTLGGLPASRYVLAIPSDFGVVTCDSPEHLRLWPDTGGNESGGQPATPGQTFTLDVIDDGGPATVVEVIASPGATVNELAEAEAMLASIRFAPLPSPAATQPSNGIVTDMVFAGSDVGLSARIPSTWQPFSDTGLPFAAVRGVTAPPMGMSVYFYSPRTTYPDPCHPVEPGEPIGPTAADVADALQAIPHITTTEASRVTFAGVPALHFVMTSDDSLPCNAEQFYIWDGNRTQGAGQVVQTWVLTVDGTPVVVSALSYPGAEQAALAEQLALLESVEFK